MASLLDDVELPPLVLSAAETVVDGIEHDRTCLVCPRPRFDTALLADVRRAITQRLRGVADGRLAEALSELAAEVQRRPRRCAASEGQRTPDDARPV